MRRLAFAVGIAVVTALVVRRVLAAPAVREAVEGALTDARAFRTSVREGMTQREGELRAALGIDAGVPRDAEVLDDPAGPRAR
ncbi:MAG: hypothetical protein U0Q14_10270 [Dermatophilaceae bacterium]